MPIVQKSAMGELVKYHVPNLATLTQPSEIAAHGVDYHLEHSAVVGWQYSTDDIAWRYADNVKMNVAIGHITSVIIFAPEWMVDTATTDNTVPLQHSPGMVTMYGNVLVIVLDTHNTMHDTIASASGRSAHHFHRTSP